MWILSHPSVLVRVEITCFNMWGNARMCWLFSKSGTNSVSCSYKAATGFLYPLERGFIFVHKPPMHIRFDEVSTVNFARSSGNTRSFDFDVDTKTGTTFTFVGIDKWVWGTFAGLMLCCSTVPITKFLALSIFWLNAFRGFKSRKMLHCMIFDVLF